MRIAELDEDKEHIRKIYEPDECEVYGWGPNNPPVFSPEIVLVDITEQPDVKGNWLYRDGEFVDPRSLLTLDGAKTTQRAALMARRDQLLAAGFDWNGHHYPLSPELSSDMLIKLTSMQMLPPPPEYIYQWKDSGGIYRGIGNAEAFKTFCAAALGYGEALFARERMLQELVEAAETIEAVEAIAWETVLEEG